MKIPAPVAPKSMSIKDVHARKCFLLGITSSEKVAQLWTQEKARLEAVQGSVLWRPRGRHGR